MNSKKTIEPIKIRTIFMGTSSFAEHILADLIKNKYNIVSVFTQPDKKSGRDHKLTPPPVKILAEKNKITVHQPGQFDENLTRLVKISKPDLLVVAAYGKILPENILRIPGFGALNVHASLLPAYRGPSPIQNAILNGDEETGITIMLMDKGMDTGDILSQKKIVIGTDEKYQELTEKIVVAGSELLLETIPRWIERGIEPKEQDKSRATYCQLIEKQDGKIFWSDEARAVYNRYRALCPWPGIFTFWEKERSIQRIRLNQISILPMNPEAKHHLGEVFQIGDKIGVQTTLGVIILEKLQIEGKNSQKIADFLNGYPDFIGTILK